MPKKHPKLKFDSQKVNFNPDYSEIALTITFLLLVKAYKVIFRSTEYTETYFSQFDKLVSATCLSLRPHSQYRARCLMADKAHSSQ